MIDLDRLRALTAKWREDGIGARDHLADSELAGGGVAMWAVYDQCADELDALLAQAEPAPAAIVGAMAAHLRAHPDHQVLFTCLTCEAIIREAQADPPAPARAEWQPTGREHELKCWPEYFEAVNDGRKPFEVRHNDRGFKVGDSLWLREYEMGECGYTGRSVRVRVTYVLASFLGIAPHYAVLGIVPLPAAPPETKEDQLAKFIQRVQDGV